MWSRGRAALGALAGALLVFAIAPYCIGWFSVPTGGIGAVTVAKYAKGFDYFVVIALTVVSALGAYVAGSGVAQAFQPAVAGWKAPAWSLASRAYARASAAKRHRNMAGGRERSERTPG